MSKVTVDKVEGVPASKTTAASVAQRMLDLLPKDGTPVLNRIMRMMLTREMETEIEPDLFFEARDLLLAQKKIGRLQGQGGQLFRDTDALPDVSPIPPTATKGWTEANLMAPMGRYLEQRFGQLLDLNEKGFFFVQDTSRIRLRKQQGRWIHPDFVLVSGLRFSLMPGVQVDVHSFELKAEFGVTNLAVYEALAQTRYTHFGHLAWHLPKNSNAENVLLEIEKQCDQHGIGLIRIYEPDELDSYEVLLDPVRKNTPHASVDGFLGFRLNDEQKQKLIALKGAMS